ASYNGSGSDWINKLRKAVVSASVELPVNRCTRFSISTRLLAGGTLPARTADTAVAHTGNNPNTNTPGPQRRFITGSPRHYGILPRPNAGSASVCAANRPQSPTDDQPLPFQS